MSPGKRSPLNILVVDDSAVVREVMTAVLAQEPGFSVTVAGDPFIAMGKMKQKRPDVIVLDLEMPRMDGLTFLRKIVREDFIPVVICSALTGPDTRIGLQALEEGAVDVVTKPRLGVRDFLHESAVVLIDAVRAAARCAARKPIAAPLAATPRLKADVMLPGKSAMPVRITSDKVVAIGASTGGTEALKSILEAMPPDAPGMVVVQHMPEGFTAAFAQRLNQACRIEVKEAADGDRVFAGRVLIAPGNLHILVRRNGAQYSVEVADGPLVSRHRPSVDVLFRSVAQSAGGNAVGVIMTGMGNDGAEGLLEMQQAGAFTLAQDESSCVVFGMPKEAIERGAVDRVVNLAGITAAILSGRTTDKGQLTRPALNAAHQGK
ncbi:MAG TPA: chemotaxis response regulator protein-glutamate methylesterase [Candidatus Limnocylindria bacterium]|nr:chemotaxis response regulator protein-glutamate methylesterase [Candidatus Limnocylindria bacterium]